MTSRIERIALTICSIGISYECPQYHTAPEEEFKAAELYNACVTYTLKRSKRARHMRLVVEPGGTVVLTAPERFSERSIEQFLASHASWIERAVARMRERKPLPVRGRRAYLEHKEAARALIEEMASRWSRFYGLQFNRIAIKDTTSLWGSCSRRGNLNFSYKLIFLPGALAEYIVAHEVCHLRHHDHGRQFWELVGMGIPDYRRLRTELRKYVLR